jgi:hypothetical protein
LIRKVLFIAAALAFTFSAAAQEPLTPLEKHLSRMDLAVSAVGIFNKEVSGNVIPTGAPNAGQLLIDSPSNTVGALATLRYVAKPFVGLEFNYGFARYTQDYSNVSGIQSNIGVQTKVNEYTIGYVVTPAHTFFGFQPFASAGAGSTGFSPTAGGGLGLKTQARATYYYSAGIQQDLFSSHFGVRAAFRQVFFLAPDYGQNFLTIKQHTISSEPAIGFYLKF